MLFWGFLNKHSIIYAPKPYSNLEGPPTLGLIAFEGFRVGVVCVGVAASGLGLRVPELVILLRVEGLGFRVNPKP